MSFSKQKMVVRGGVSGFDLDAGVGEAAVVEVEDGVDQIGSADAGGTDGLAMEAKGLGGDLADAGELVLGRVDIAADGFGKFAGQIDKVEEVGDGLEGVVDLVRDGTREAADSGEFFTLNESGFRPFLIGHLEDDSSDSLNPIVRVVDGGVADVPVAMFAGTGGQFAFEEDGCERDWP